MASSFKRRKQLNNNTAFCGDLETFWSGRNVENLRLLLKNLIMDMKLLGSFDQFEPELK